MVKETKYYELLEVSPDASEVINNKIGLGWVATNFCLTLEWSEESLSQIGSQVSSW